jgi:cell division protein FtsW
VPALVTAYPVRAYVGRSRFVLAPLSLTLDQLLFLITAALLCVGLVMVQSADSRIRASTGNWLTAAFNTKNAIHAVIAMAALTLLWRWDYRKLLGPGGEGGGGRFPMLRSPATWLIVLTIGTLVAVLVTPLGKEINGARRWLAVGPIGFQPSELAKLSLVLFVSAYAVHRQGRVRSFVWGFLPLIVIFAMAAGLVVKEDFGTTVLIAAVVLVMILMAGCRWWHVGLLIPPAAVIIHHMLNTPFRRARLLAFLDPFADMKGAGYHPAESLLTIASGGFWGLGLGQGIQKMGYLPEDNTDFIFAVICEELGFFGALMVVGLFVVFVMIGWRIASRCPHQFGKMVAFGITAMIGLQAAINIAVVTVTMPTKGIALPFISSGGTGWIMNAVAVGVLMSIERVNRLEREVGGIGEREAEPALGFPVQVRAVPVVPVESVA